MNNQKNLLFVITLAAMVSFPGCKKDTVPTVTVQNFSVTIEENPAMNQSLGFVDASIENANNVGFSFANQYAVGDLSNYISLDRTTGEIIITDPSWFDFEESARITPAQANVEVYNSSDEMASAHFTITINLTDVEETPPPAALSVQQRLSGGETPIAIYITDNTLLDSLYGKNYAGGFIAYLNTITGNGFAVAEADLSIALIWDPNQPAGSGTAGTNSAIGNGPLNTNAIVNTIGAGSYAAQACNDLVLNTFSDWFLPSKDELTEIYNNLHLNGVGNFQNMSYWSSSETGTVTMVWYRKFDTGQEGMGGSEQLFGVRAARAF